MKFLFAALAAAAVGCGSNGAIHVSITDTPATGNVQKVLITVNEIRVHDDGDPNGTPGGTGATNDGATGQGWLVLCNDVQTFDLLTLQNGATLPLCNNQQMSVPTGNISQLRLGVQSAQIVTDTGTQDLDVPSGSNSGFKVDVNEAVAKDQVLEIKLDFNAAASLTQQGNGSWSLKPVIHVVP
jgi:hypothetical protein